MLGISEGRPHCRISRRTSQTSSNRLIRAVLGSLSGRRSCDLLVSRFLASKKKERTMPGPAEQVTPKREEISDSAGPLESRRRRRRKLPRRRVVSQQALRKRKRRRPRRTRKMNRSSSPRMHPPRTCFGPCATSFAARRRMPWLSIVSRSSSTPREEHRACSMLPETVCGKP